MKSECRHCGATLVSGRIQPSETSPSGAAEPTLAFVVSRGSRSTWNPIKALIKGIRREPKYEEQMFPVRATACTHCGAVEFFLDQENMEALDKWLEG